MNIVPADPLHFVIAIDPGKTTGVAWLSTEGIFGFGEAEGRFEFYRQFRSWLEGGHVPEVVIEDWQVRKDTAVKSAQVDPWRIIGYVEGLCEQHGYQFTTQTPGQAKSFGSDDKLAKLGWSATTKGGHARDAARHLLTYLVRRYPGEGQIGSELLGRLL